MTQPQSGLSRRTLAKGAAWSVPAVAIAAAAPAMAASCVPTLDINPNTSCKKANANSYYLVFDVAMTADCPIPAGCTATITKIIANGGSGQTIWTGSAVDGQGITICEAPNMGAYLEVWADLSCVEGGAKAYRVKMPQVTSLAGSACKSPTFCVNGTTSTTTTTAPTTTTTSTTSTTVTTSAPASTSTTTK